MVVPESKAVRCPKCDSDRTIGMPKDGRFYCLCYHCHIWFVLVRS